VFKLSFNFDLSLEQDLSYHENIGRDKSRFLSINAAFNRLSLDRLISSPIRHT